MFGGYAERKYQMNLTGTTDALGPGAYITCDTGLNYCKSALVNAPFNSWARRNTSGAGESYDLLYNAKLRKHIKNGNSLQFTARRFPYKEAIWDNPSPTAYDPQIQTKKCKPVRRERGIGNLYLCSVQFTTEDCAPTIPTKIDENGYFIGEDDQIIKIPANEYDQTLGPAFYDVPSGELNYNSKKYAGCVWYKMVGRKPTGDYGMPGPGDYDPKYTLCAKRKEDEKIREMKRRYSSIPRSYTEQAIQQAVRENLPGPGEYEVKSSFGRERKISLCPIPLITAEKRFVYNIDDNPTPVTYNPCDCFKHRQDFAVKRVSFLSETERLKSKIGGGPGPGEYKDHKPRCRLTYSVPVPFQARTDRWSYTKKTTDEFPGPGQYEVLNEIQPRRNADSSMFRSVVPRMKTRLRETTPPPLDGRSTWPVKLKRRRPKIGNAAFRSKTSRNFIFVSKNPSPGEYDVTEVSCKHTGQYFNISPRFSQKEVDFVPGPGYYTVHPKYGMAVHKSRETYNSKIKEQIQKRLIKPRPFTATTKKKRKKKEEFGLTGKKLRWFARPTTDYIHCLDDY